MKIQVQIDNQNYDVEIEDIHARPVIALIEGERFEVWPEEKTESIPTTKPIKSAVPGASVIPASAPVRAGSDSAVITSPLPGVIVSIDVKVGEAVKHGQGLCTLEAMKMKNAIRSIREGTVDEIHVSVGDQVQHGQRLISFKA